MEWTIGAIARTWAAHRPDEIAISCGRQSITYAEIDRRSNQVAQGFLAANINQGARVALIDKNALEQFDVLFGASKVGAVLVQVNWRLAPREISAILQDSTAEIVFIGTEFVEIFRSIQGDLTTMREVIVFGEVEGFTSYDAWVGRHPSEDPMINVRPADTALQLYTSGTTGLPKGAMISASNLFTLLNHANDLWGLSERSISIVCLPLFHIGGIGWALACLRFGGKVELTRQFDSLDMLRLIESSHATHANFVPAMLATMVEAARTCRHDYSSLQMVLYGTAPISNALLTQSIDTFGCAFVQVYGLTETTSAITQLDAKDHDPGGPYAARLRSAGRPYPWVEAMIVDPHTGRTCSPHETGELLVRSAQNMQGYWRNETATAETLTSDGWLRTGDAGYFDEDGYLFLTDRVKDMIISGGENIYPAEIERLLSEHPDVSEIAVIGIPDKAWGEAVKAVVVAKPGSVPTEHGLIEWTRARIAHYKCPKSISFVEALPRNATGKILKRVLREPYWKGVSRRVG